VPSFGVPTTRGGCVAWGTMLSRFGLRSRMAVSYVLVSAAAVLVVEAVALAAVAPRVLAARESVERAQERAAEAEADAVRYKAERLVVETAAAIGAAATDAAASAPGRSDAEILAATAGRLDKGVDPKRDPGSDPVLLLALTTVDGRVVDSTAETVIARGAVVPEAVVAGGAPTRSGRTAVAGRAGGWAVTPVRVSDAAGSDRVAGAVYARMLVEKAGLRKAAGTKVPDSGIGFDALLLPGGVVLLLLVPVGALFGLFSTGPLIRRIRRLADGTSTMADGDLGTRLPVSGNDEVAMLERSFNTMAERLEKALAAQRAVAGAEARRAERTRITRELHDSISQHLFSASLVAGGLRKALPPGSELQHQAGSLERSLEHTKREMRAMLLELRPVALEDAGLAEALDELCRSYRIGLGISATARVDGDGLATAVEHAVLRVVQEAVGNAVRHGRPTTVEVEVVRAGGRVEVTVRDDGVGFEPATGDRHGMGLDLMRDRVGELDGTVDVASAPERGTTVRVLIPVDAT
jgi:signal transduction histidine kinase